MSLNGPVLTSSFELVLERNPKLTERFYEIFFTRYPQVKPLFGTNSTEAQAEMLATALVSVIDHLDDAPWLTQNLRALGLRHVDYGVSPDMYAWVGECLLAAMAEAAGGDWTKDIEVEWTKAYGAIVQLMLTPAPA
ncbi:MAG: flavohemoprotein [Alphaproteobacteria bacterium]|nr:flavohemoprotein [Alphaproteobacteria bacterium]